jgi:hypothetical protein
MGGYYHGGVAAESGTTVVASWSNPKVPMIGFSNEHCFVAISHFPAHDNYIGVSGEFYQMWENALNWVVDSCLIIVGLRGSMRLILCLSSIDNTY